MLFWICGKGLGRIASENRHLESGRYKILNIKLCRMMKMNMKKK